MRNCPAACPSLKPFIDGVGAQVKQARDETTKVKSFDLDQVKLLDVEFKRATELNKQYLLNLEPDRLVSWFRKEANLPSKSPVYGGWESQGVAGHTLGHYLSACALMYRTTGDERLRQRINYIVDELEACQKANRNGYVARRSLKGKRIFAEIARGEIDPPDLTLTVVGFLSTRCINCLPDCATQSTLQATLRLKLSP